MRIRATSATIAEDRAGRVRNSHDRRADPPSAELRHGISRTQRRADRDRIDGRCDEPGVRGWRDDAAAYLLALAIVAASARKHRDFLAAHASLHEVKRRLAEVPATVIDGCGTLPHWEAPERTVTAIKRMLRLEE